MSEDKQPAEDPTDRWLKEAEQWRMTFGVSPSYTGGQPIYSPSDASWQMVDTPVKPSAGRTPADEAPAGTMADETQAAKDGRSRSKVDRQARILKLFEVEGRRDLTVAQMAKTYSVDRKTIQRDLKQLGLSIKLPPDIVP